MLKDVRCGFVSAAAAREAYGVVIADGAIDEAATELLRREMRSDEAPAHFDFGPARDEYERVWTRERYDALTEILAGLPVNWRFFIKHKIFAAMAERRNPEGDGSGALVHRLFGEIARAYPQLGMTG